MRGHITSTVVPAQLANQFESWWDNASAADFGALALCVVVCVWFVARYYSE